MEVLRIFTQGVLLLRNADFIILNVFSTDRTIKIFKYCGTPLRQKYDKLISLVSN